jgi:hypothetical protein
VPVLDQDVVGIGRLGLKKATLGSQEPDQAKGKIAGPALPVVRPAGKPLRHLWGKMGLWAAVLLLRHPMTTTRPDQGKDMSTSVCGNL